MLKQLNALPDGFLDTSITELEQLLGQPTLIHLEGENKKPLFISTLLHGNEDSGLTALQVVLKKYEHKTLPRSLSLFIGNVSAASQHMRHLENQPDYNRVWPGTEHDSCAETDMMQQVVDIMSDRHPFASIDLHNNTGRNPHYACINKLTPQYLQLARLFSHTVVYFITPRGVQSAAFAEFCPAVTLECGKAGELDGIEHVARYIETVLQLEHLPDHKPSDIDLFHTVARVTIPESINFSFDGSSELTLNSDIELYNFREVQSGTLFSSHNSSDRTLFHAWNETEQDVAGDFFDITDSQVLLKKPVMPSMFTRNEEVIRQDCLCYLMERIDKETI